MHFNKIYKALIKHKCYDCLIPFESPTFNQSAQQTVVPIVLNNSHQIAVSASSNPNEPSRRAVCNPFISAVFMTRHWFDVAAPSLDVALTQKQRGVA